MKGNSLFSLFSQAHARTLTYWTRLPRLGSTSEEFIPLAVELWGGWHNSATHTIHRIASLAARATASDVPATVSRVWQRLSVLIYSAWLIHLSLTLLRRC